MVNKVSRHLEMECWYLVFSKFLIFLFAVFIHYTIAIVSIRFDVTFQSYMYFGNSTRNGYSLDLLSRGIPSEYFSDNFETAMRESKMSPREKGQPFKKTLHMMLSSWWVSEIFHCGDILASRNCLTPNPYIWLSLEILFPVHHANNA